MAQFDYQALNAELESILAELEAGNLNIDQALKQYERGMFVVKELQKYLKLAENKVKKIKRD